MSKYYLVTTLSEGYHYDTMLFHATDKADILNFLIGRQVALLCFVEFTKNEIENINEKCKVCDIRREKDND